MQPQGHPQTLVRMLDSRQNPQAACDAPRWRFNASGLEINVEAAIDTGPRLQGLAELGHRMEVINDSYQDFGAGQFIWRAGVRPSRATWPPAMRDATAWRPDTDVGADPDGGRSGLDRPRRDRAGLDRIGLGRRALDRAARTGAPPTRPPPTRPPATRPPSTPPPGASVPAWCWRRSARSPSAARRSSSSWPTATGSTR